MIGGVSIGCIYALVALGFVLIYKATEVVNFAQGELMMLGAFLAYTFIFILGWNYWIGAAAAIVCMFFAGNLVDRVVLHHHGDHRVRLYGPQRGDDGTGLGGGNLCDFNAFFQ